MSVDRPLQVITAAESSLRRLLSESTPGPWRAEGPTVLSEEFTDDPWPVASCVTVGFGIGEAGDARRRAVDALLIEHLHRAAPTLLWLLERARFACITPKADVEGSREHALIMEALSLAHAILGTAYDDGTGPTPAPHPIERNPHDLNDDDLND